MTVLLDLEHGIAIKYRCHRGGELKLNKQLSFSKGEVFPIFPEVTSARTFRPKPGSAPRIISYA
jgi:hypothetical protein